MSISVDRDQAFLAAVKTIAFRSMVRAEVRSALDDFERAGAEPGRRRLGTIASVLRFNNLKLAV
jgi:hypothetical protein